MSSRPRSSSAQPSRPQRQRIPRRAHRHAQPGTDVRGNYLPTMSIDRPLRENREQGHGASRRVHCRQSRVQRGPSRPSRPVPTVPHPSHGDDRGEPEKWFERSSKRTANDAERARENAENHDDGDKNVDAFFVRSLQIRNDYPLSVRRRGRYRRRRRARTNARFTESSSRDASTPAPRATSRTDASIRARSQGQTAAVSHSSRVMTRQLVDPHRATILSSRPSPGASHLVASSRVMPARARDAHLGDTSPHLPWRVTHGWCGKRRRGARAREAHRPAPSRGVRRRSVRDGDAKRTRERGRTGRARSLELS